MNLLLRGFQHQPVQALLDARETADRHLAIGGNINSVAAAALQAILATASWAFSMARVTSAISSFSARGEPTAFALVLSRDWLELRVA